MTSEITGSGFEPRTAIQYTEPISLSKFLTDFTESLCAPKDAVLNLQEVGSRWLKNIPAKVSEDISRVCSASVLYARSSAQTVRLPDNAVPGGALDQSQQTSTLRSVLLFRDELKRRAAEVSANAKLARAIPSEPSTSSAASETSSDKAEPQQSFTGPHHHPPNIVGERVTDNEIVITVRIYRQYLKSRKQRTCILGEYILLGCHPLTVLRDAIVCESDYASLAGDLSNQPEAIAKGLPVAKDRYTSGYFFINETFYEDLRHPDSIRLSDQIMASAKEAGLAFRTDDMAQTRFNQLTVRLGYPYLYVHQGNCEHLVVFSDVRLFSETTDCSLVSCYPVLTHKFHVFRRPCMCCWRLGSKWAVSNCLLCPEDPTLMCGTCVDRLLYDEQGNKLPEAGAFRLFALPSVSLGMPPAKKGGVQTVVNSTSVDMTNPASNDGDMPMVDVGDIEAYDSEIDDD